MKTRFILIETSHAGNVGAAARAMKTMGFDDLVLVRPRWANVLRQQETIQRASGAVDVLAHARVVDALDDALHGMTHLCATAMTARDFGPPTRAPRQHFEALVAAQAVACAGQARAADGHGPASGGDPTTAGMGTDAGVALLFGSERFGMRNEDVYRCNVALSIPSNPGFGSLNLGAAIQLLAYEWRQALGGFGPPVVPAGHVAQMPAQTSAQAPTLLQADGLADAQQIAGMLAHWQQALVHVGYLNPAAPKKLMPRLQQMFNRAQLTQQEIHILRGIARTMLLSTPHQPGHESGSQSRH